MKVTITPSASPVIPKLSWDEMLRTPGVYQLHPDAKEQDREAIWLVFARKQDTLTNNYAFGSFWNPMRMERCFKHLPFTPSNKKVTFEN